ncbi:MAG TPA: hypothetical protein DCQ49_00595, partial [Methylophaga sp.]|nr:hypothetical protein [Methylophaga sp.]
MPGTSMYKAVVLEVLYDPGKFNEEVTKDLIDTLNIVNKAALKTAPLNSCIVRFFGPGTSGQKSQVVYPFFPPHLCMPVKAGECVWVMSPDPSQPNPEDSYWMCRITGALKADDTNFTHWPRSFSGGTDQSSTRTSARAVQAAVSPTGTRIKPTFLNKSGDGDVLQVATGSKDKPKPPVAPNPFNKIIETSYTYQDFAFETVPQLTKRPGDLVLQGSHNTSITLGQDRGWTKNDDSATIAESETSNALFDPLGSNVSTGTGTIDFVTGRGRYMPQAEMTIDQDGDAPERTNVRTVFNSRENIEILKIPLELSQSKNFAGGDPDFACDASRIYMSTKTSADHNFGLNKDVSGTPVGFEAPIDDVDDAAYIVAKSDEIRIVARKQTANEFYATAGDPEIKGSIRIIKEGSNNDDLAAVCLLPDGTIQVSGNKIFLGRSTTDGGAGGGPGPGSSQPYVKYQELEDLLTSILDDIKAFAQ